MNEIVNKLLLARDKFMPEIHLRQPGFTYSACGPFTKNKEVIKKSKETGDSRYIYQKELDEACFQHDMASEDFKNVSRRTFANKVFHYKAFNIAKDAKYDGYQRELTSMVYKFFDKKTSDSGIKKIPNKELAEDLHKPIIRKFNKRKVQSSFIDHISSGDLAYMQLISQFNKGFLDFYYVLLTFIVNMHWLFL